MSETILIADDDAQNRELITEILCEAGYTVVQVTDGHTALHRFGVLRPDLVLLDVQMPGLSGFDVCRAIKADPDTRLQPVVFITGLTALEDRVRGIEAGGDDLLNKPVQRVELLARVRSLLSLKHFTDELEHAEAVLFALAESIEGKDPYTVGHCQRLASYAARLGQECGLSDDQIKTLRCAGIVHDIGKVAVPDAVLLKPARLTSEEFAVMKQHTVVGERICSPLHSFRDVLPIIRSHHERRDGSGYPDGLRGEQVPITARVLQVVDVYDALTTDRPYKRACSLEQALETMQDEVNRGWWDPYVFATFEQMMTSDAIPENAHRAATG
ncbi:MAG TPA: HD domain-containing phosphohydrolase [Terriglobales bacterium]|nr:HD domain-containing phosphohydrolase [Terriglobales bacterium]